MSVTSRRRAAVACLVALSAAAASCRRPAESPESAFRTRAATGEWTLVELFGEAAPTGAGGRPATLRIEGAESRAGGFAGCNRYGGSYELRGDSLTFGAIAMTKMACDQGMALEQRLAEALAATRRWELGAD